MGVVLLPGCPDVPELPVFLRSFGYVDFRRHEPDPLEQLIWGITGKRPAFQHDEPSRLR
jgi:hypothetical protein